MSSYSVNDKASVISAPWADNHKGKCSKIYLAQGVHVRTNSSLQTLIYNVHQAALQAIDIPLDRLQEVSFHCSKERTVVAIRGTLQEGLNTSPLREGDLACLPKKYERTVEGALLYLKDTLEEAEEEQFYTPYESFAEMQSRSASAARCSANSAFRPLSVRSASFDFNDKGYDLRMATPQISLSSVRSCSSIATESDSLEDPEFDRLLQQMREEAEEMRRELAAIDREFEQKERELKLKRSIDI